MPQPLAESAFEGLHRAAGRLMRGRVATLKAMGLSPTQFNVLRILKEAGAEGRTCGEIAGRMITRDPDITRLLDRLEKRGWVVRSREHRDRRVITARITGDGRSLVERLERPLEDLYRAQFGRLSEESLKTLIGLLDSIG